MVNVYESGAFGFSVSPNPLNCLRRYSRITSMFAWTWGSSSIRSSLLWPFVIVIASPNRALLWFDICRAHIERLQSRHFTHSSNLIVMMLDNGVFFKREGNLLQHTSPVSLLRQSQPLRISTSPALSPNISLTPRRPFLHVQ